MLELVAMISMLMDHLGITFWPDFTWLRIVGRLAMPLYVFALARGFQHSRSRYHYAKRLLIVAVVAQPFHGVLGAAPLNMGFTLLAGFLVLYGLDLAPEWARRIRGQASQLGTAAVRGLVLAAGVLAFHLLPMEYGLYALVLLLLYRYVNAPLLLVGGHAVLNMVVGGHLQGYSVVATGLLVLPLSYPHLDRWRLIYRAFYPAHLAVLAALVWMR